MTFSHTKLMLFHRQDPKKPREGADDIICIFPDGKLARTEWPWLHFEEPCYGQDVVVGRKSGNGFRDFYCQFPSPQGALDAMRAYEKRNNLPNAELIGTI